MTEQQTPVESAILRGTVLEVDFDADTIQVELENGERKSFPFEVFDSQDVYQAGQHFELTLSETGQADQVAEISTPESQQRTVNGYVESVDQDDELVWVYVRNEEGWQRKVMPLELFQESGLARPGAHFLLDLDENGTPTGLRPDEAELEMLPLQAEETKPRWTTRPSAEAEPEA